MIDDLTRRAAAVLAELGTATQEELASRLDVDLEAMYDVLKSSRFEELPDDRWADAWTLVAGFTLTHRLTADEAATGLVHIHPDLFVLPAFSDPDYGGRGTFTLQPGGRFAMPKPARAGELVAFRFVDGELDTAPARVDESHVADVVDALHETFHEVCDSDGDDKVDVLRLLLVAHALHPGLFAEPRPPLGELLTSAGLDLEDGFVREPHDDEDDDDDTDSGLEECCEQGLGLALAGYAMREDADDISANKIGVVLSHGAVAPAFLVALAGEDATEVKGFLDKVVGAATRDGRAGPRFALSVLAEQRGDTAEAERLLEESLRADAEYQPALVEAAWYAEDRGDAARALSLLRRAGATDDDPHMQRLLRFVPGAAGRAAGRNDPCPCGSGRKYKACCARAAAPLQSRLGWVYDKLVAYAVRPPQVYTVDAIAEQGPDTGDANLDDGLALELAIFDGEILEGFISDRGPLLPADELALVRTWTSARRRLYRVEAVRAGHGLDLRDAASGETVVVAERRASQALREGNLFFARVVADGVGHQIVGAPTVVALQQRDSLLELLATDPGPLEIAAWMDAATRPPTLVTREQEPVVLCESTYEVSDPDAARTALESVLEQDHEGAFIDTVEVNGESVIRGWVRIEGDRLTVNTTSEPRLERFAAIVAGALPDARLLDESRTPAHDALDAYRRSNVTALPQRLPPEVRAHMAGLVEDWEQRWVDMQLPALGGLTPRQALDDPARRDDLISLIAEMDRSPDDDFAMSARRVRDLLGLVD